MAPRKKAAICVVFGLGIFTIIAAVLNKYYSFTNPFGSDWTEWYCHESSTNMMVANLPFVYTLLRRLFKLKSLDSSYKCGTDSKFKSGKTTGKMATLMSRRGGNTVIDEAERGLKDNPITVVTNIEIEEEKESLDGDKKQYEMDFLGSGVTDHIVITGNAGPSVERLQVPPPASRRPSN
ncbi:hypothetical protein KVT40_006891 [Elsinoe batatas]|uniref:Uncharacterized protein n=1 Tax=Elsinoe batatas TaxID=2601811 RepID=A0A8K0PAY3_9PEZI|nr:hypothetical protein KVT40_006891 [Elsinoe batatas]